MRAGVSAWVSAGRRVGSRALGQAPEGVLTAGVDADDGGAERLDLRGDQLAVGQVGDDDSGTAVAQPHAEGLRPEEAAEWNRDRSIL